jgi:hypothetical protein
MSIRNELLYISGDEKASLASIFPSNHAISPYKLMERSYHKYAILSSNINYLLKNSSAIIEPLMAFSTAPKSPIINY